MGKLTEALYRAIALFFTITGDALSDQDKAELREIFTEGNIASLCDILSDCEREGVFEEARQ